MHVRQPSVDSVVAIGELFVIDAQHMQNRGVEVVAVGRIVGFPAPFVALAEAGPALDSRAGEP